MAKYDPYNHEKKWKDWKERVKSGIPNISRANSKVIMQYLDDMEVGINIAKGTVKGGRSYIRLNTLRDRMLFYFFPFNQSWQCRRLNSLVVFFDLCGYN
jgi:hypothetical protein